MRWDETTGGEKAFLAEKNSRVLEDQCEAKKAKMKLLRQKKTHCSQHLIKKMACTLYLLLVINLANLSVVLPAAGLHSFLAPKQHSPLTGCATTNHTSCVTSVMGQLRAATHLTTLNTNV